MGFRIDRFALTVLLAGALYIFFISAMGSIPIAAAAAFLSMAILRKLSEKLPTDRIGRKRRNIKKAKAEMEELSLTSRSSVEKRIHEVLRSTYGDNLGGTIIYTFLRHPVCGRLTGDDVCRIWRDHKGDDRLLIVSTAKADPAAVQLAHRLSDPEIALIDGEQLVQLIAKCKPSPSGAFTRPMRRTGRLNAAARAAGRTNPVKCSMTAITMFILFWFTGTVVYLIGALMLAFIAGVSIRKKRAPRELFAS